MASTDAVTTEHEDQGVLACARIREHHFQDVLHEVFLFAFWKSMYVLNTVSCANTVCMYAYDPHRFPLCFTKTHTGPCPSRIHTHMHAHPGASVRADSVNAGLVHNMGRDSQALIR